MRAFAALRRVVLNLVLVGTGAAAAIAIALFHDGASAIEIAGVVLAAVPPAIVAAFWFLLGKLRGLPERLRAPTPRLWEQLFVYAKLLPLVRLPVVAGVVVGAVGAIVVEAVVAVILGIVAVS